MVNELQITEVLRATADKGIAYVHELLVDDDASGFHDIVLEFTDGTLLRLGSWYTLDPPEILGVLPPNAEMSDYPELIGRRAVAFILDVYRCVQVLLNNGAVVCVEFRLDSGFALSTEPWPDSLAYAADPELLWLDEESRLQRSSGDKFVSDLESLLHRGDAGLTMESRQSG